MPDRENHILREYALTSGELGAVSAQTVVVALLPVLLASYAPSNLWIGFAVGGEGIFALLLPFWSGAVSDRLPRRIVQRLGRRMPLLLAAAPVMAAALAAAPFLSGYWPLAAAAFLCFAALHAYLTPFWSLLIDAVPDRRRGRVQGMRGVFRALGLGYGLVAAGLLFGAWRPLPFLVAAALVLATTGATWLAARGARTRELPPPRGGVQEAWKALARNKPAFWLLGANALFDAAVDAIRPYVFLYARRVLGTTVWQTSMGLLLLVAGLGVGSYIIGHLGDRYDRVRILEFSVAALALAFVAGYFARSIPVALAVGAAAGIGAAGVMALPYPVYAKLVGEEATGENTGIYVVAVSFGRILAPLLAGGVVDIAARWDTRYRGYPAMWLVAAFLAGLGWLALRRSARFSRRRGRRSEAPPRQAAPVET